MEVYYKIESKKGEREGKWGENKKKGLRKSGVLVIFLFKRLNSKLKKFDNLLA